MMFFNPSLRTRNSFEPGIYQLGGETHFLKPSGTRLPALEGEKVAYKMECIAGVSRVLPRMGDALPIRILGDAVGRELRRGLRSIEELAFWSEILVINMEDNVFHPSQGMADAMTLRELFG